jgi:steroid delta-isomerase-like uncharacterized protein
MRSIALAHRYFDAWNRHDAAAVAASFAPDGTDTDPTAGPGLKPEATAAYAAALFTAFPDLVFDLDAIHAVDDRAVVGRWVMRGAQTGTLRDIPPTGRRVALPGVDVLTVASEGIASVVGYFDRQTPLEQLGLHGSNTARRVHPDGAPGAVGGGGGAGPELQPADYAGTARDERVPRLGRGGRGQPDVQVLRIRIHPRRLHQRVDPARIATAAGPLRRLPPSVGGGRAHGHL